jgi:predicted amidohydrolase
MPVSKNLDTNLQTILTALEQHETDYMVFPEMALTGWHAGFGQRSVENACERIAELCRKRYTTAIVGTGFQENGATLNQVRVYSDAGELIGTQEKLVPTKEERGWCRPGEELRVFDHNGLRFGCLIGNDLWVAPGLGPYPDPRLTYRLAERGARVIFHSARTGVDPAYAAYYESNVTLRAKEAGCLIACANAAADEGKLNAQSGIVGPDGGWLTSCPREGDQVCHADIEPE